MVKKKKKKEKKKKTQCLEIPPAWSSNLQWKAEIQDETMTKPLAYFTDNYYIFNFWDMADLTAFFGLIFMVIELELSYF